MIQVSRTYEKIPQYIKELLDNANVFYTEVYYNLLKKEKSNVLYIYDEREIQIVSIHKTLKIFNFAFFPSESFVFDPDKSENSLFLDGVINELDKIGVHWLSVTPACSFFHSYPSRSKRIPWGNYVINLAFSEEELLKNATNKHGNMIRRGEKSNIEVKYGGMELLDDYLKVDLQTWRRSDQNVDHRHYYSNIMKELKGNAIIGISYKDGIPQCGLLGYYNKAMFYYMFGASANRPEPGSTHYLQWKTILLMKAKGVLKYSFVGCRIDVDKNSKLHNIQHFKEGFGGELVESYMFKSVICPFKLKLFKILLFIRTRKKSSDVVDQEIYKWKNLNR